jgi:hypothetical protein
MESRQRTQNKTEKHIVFEQKQKTNFSLKGTITTCMFFQKVARLQKIWKIFANGTDYRHYSNKIVSPNKTFLRDVFFTFF